MKGKQNKQRKTNTKGFIFSIEALSAMAIIILALGIFAYSTTTNTNKTNNTQIQTQAGKQMIQYFGLSEDTPNTTANEQYCSQIIIYNPTITPYDPELSLTKKQACRWIQ